MHELPPNGPFSSAPSRISHREIAGNRQILPDAPGATVRVRARTGRVTSIRRHDACTAYGIVFANGRPRALVLLAPFDRLQALPDAARWTRCGWRRVAAAIGRAAAEASGLPDAARLAAGASELRLLDWQLEPALALVEGRASRVLVADAVGLGKTVQAAWALLATTDPSRDRALVLTPAGLRDQWQAELGRLFGLEATIVDAAHLRRLRRELPPTVSPWSMPGVFVAAVDFAKQPEVLAGLLETRWSLVVLDEAHGLGTQTDRRRAADLLARSADGVLLLTATPHSGDPAAFEELCRIGSVAGDVLETIRRTRADVRLPSCRTVRTIALRPTTAERRLHLALRGYLGRLRAGGLLDAEASALLRSVLLKRAASSSHALLRSLIRRRDAVSGRPAEPAQDELPFGGPGEHDGGDAWMPDVIDAPALTDRRSEAAALEALVADAGEAARADSKAAALQRLLRRAREPALVFTEYRDTLDRLASALPDARVATLHGGMTRAERRDAAHAFRTGAARVLLATDAAGEGLNLHHACRLVINVDMPWNPNRLEQRIGRVDRLGQTRRVHAVILTTRLAAERALARRFAARQRRIVLDLGSGGGAPFEPGTGGASSGRVALLRSAAALVRAAGAPHESRPRVGRFAARSVPWTIVSPALRKRLELPRGILLVYGVRATTVQGIVAASTAVPVIVRCGNGGRRRAARDLLRACERAARSVAAREGGVALAEALRVHRLRVERLRARVAASLETVPASPRPYQAGLFDRRAMTAALKQRLADGRRRDELRDALDRLAALERIEPEPRLRPLAALVLR